MVDAGVFPVGCPNSVTHIDLVESPLATMIARPSGRTAAPPPSPARESAVIGYGSVYGCTPAPLKYGFARGRTSPR